MAGERGYQIDHDGSWIGMVRPQSMGAGPVERCDRKKASADFGVGLGVIPDSGLLTWISAGFPGFDFLVP